MIFRSAHMKVAGIVGGGCFLAFGIAVGLAVLAVAVRGATETLSLEFEGVCIDAPEPGYSSEGGGGEMSVYKSGGPDLRLEIGPEPDLPSTAIDVARANPGVFMPVTGASGTYVAAERSPGVRIVRVTIERGSEAERANLISRIRFCPMGGPDAKP